MAFSYVGLHGADFINMCYILDICGVFDYLIDNYTVQRVLILKLPHCLTNVLVLFD